VVSTAAFDEDELDALERVGRRRTVTHLVDIRQRHLEEFFRGGDQA
jgi:hypothetical protein